MTGKHQGNWTRGSSFRTSLVTKSTALAPSSVRGYVCLLLQQNVLHKSVLNLQNILLWE